jgi:ABC-2 type transport system permease protein
MSMEYSLYHFRNDLHGAWAIAKKDLVIYYLKPNIYMSGLLFPVFMLLAFAVGKTAPIATLIPGLIAITSLFSASSIEPVAIPIERRTKTFDRLLSAPVSLFALVLGESVSGLLFSGSICLLLFAGAAVLLRTVAFSLPVVLLAIALSCFTFAAMGAVFSAYPTENVGEVMSLLNLFRLPLIFISGVFIPLEQLPPWGLTVARLSPLTYGNDLVRYGFEGTTHFGIAADVVLLLVFTALFLLLGNFLYRKFNE